MKTFLNALLYTTIGGILVALFTYWLSGSSSADLTAESETVRLPTQFVATASNAIFPVPTLPQKPKVPWPSTEKQVDDYLIALDTAVRQMTAARENQNFRNENITNISIENRTNIRSKEVEIYIPNLEVAVVVRGGNKRQIVEKSAGQMKISFLDPEEKIQITALTSALFFDAGEIRVLHDGKKVVLRKTREDFERDHFGIRKLIAHTSPFSDFVILIFGVIILVIAGVAIRFILIWNNFPALARLASRDEIARSIKTIEQVEKLYPEKLPPSWKPIQK